MPAESTCPEARPFAPIRVARAVEFRRARCGGDRRRPATKLAPPACRCALNGALLDRFAKAPDRCPARHRAFRRPGSCDEPPAIIARPPAPPPLRRPRVSLPVQADPPPTRQTVNPLPRGTAVAGVRVAAHRLAAPAFP